VGTDDEAAMRGVERCLRTQRFVTEAWGLAHVTLTTKQPHLMCRCSSKRVRALGFEMSLSPGQHTNYKELSYYARTPSGFEWAVGWNLIGDDVRCGR
jgi:hypothetical protein